MRLAGQATSGRRARPPRAAAGRSGARQVIEHPCERSSRPCRTAHVGGGAEACRHQAGPRRRFRDEVSLDSSSERNCPHVGGYLGAPVGPGEAMSATPSPPAQVASAAPSAPTSPLAAGSVTAAARTAMTWSGVQASRERRTLPEPAASSTYVEPPVDGGTDPLQLLTPPRLPASPAYGEQRETCHGGG
jgi:hypothetical protein